MENVGQVGSADGWQDGRHAVRWNGTDDVVGIQRRGGREDRSRVDVQVVECSIRGLHQARPPGEEELRIDPCDRPSGVKVNERPGHGGRDHRRRDLELLADESADAAGLQGQGGMNTGDGRGDLGIGCQVRERSPADRLRVVHHIVLVGVVYAREHHIWERAGGIHRYSSTAVRSREGNPRACLIRSIAGGPGIGQAGECERVRDVQDAGARQPRIRHELHDAARPLHRFRSGRHDEAGLECSIRGGVRGGTLEVQIIRSGGGGRDHDHRVGVPRFGQVERAGVVRRDHERIVVQQAEAKERRGAFGHHDRAVDHRRFHISVVQHRR